MTITITRPKLELFLFYFILVYPFLYSSNRFTNSAFNLEKQNRCRVLSENQNIKIQNSFVSTKQEKVFFCYFDKCLISLHHFSGKFNESSIDRLAK